METKNKNKKTIEENILDLPARKHKTPQEDKTSFDLYKIHEKTKELLVKKGIVALFPIQYTTFEMIYSGKDMVAKDKTGSGKTLGYALPNVERMRAAGHFVNKERGRRPLIMVIVPTRELCIQVTKVYEMLKHNQSEYQVLSVYGGTDIQQQIMKLRRGVDMIIGTPGRVIDLSNRQILKYDNLRSMTLDEADEMLKMGFQEDIEQIYKMIHEVREKEEVQNLLFSATVPRWIFKTAKTFLKDDHKFIDLLKGVKLQTPKTVDHLALNCSYHNRINIISDVVKCYAGMSKYCIIFCDTKREANNILLNADIIQSCAVLHGDIPQKQREITFEAFRKGQIMCLIATNVAARGIDIPQTDLIIQLSPPQYIDTYIHRAGRTARAGRQGICITFYDKNKMYTINNIERKANFKFQKVGVPQPIDITKAQAKDIHANIKGVKPESIGLFKEVAEKILTEMGPEEALQRAFAYICKQDGKIHQRSVLCGLKGFVTFEVDCSQQFRSLSFIWAFLKRNFQEHVTGSIKGMKDCTGSKKAVFDVPEKFAPQFHEYIKFQEGGDDDSFKIVLCTELPDLVERSQNGGNSRFGFRGGQRRFGNNRRNGGFQRRGQGNRHFNRGGFNRNSGGFQKKSGGFGFKRNG